MRLERAFLLEQLHKHMEYTIDDSDRSSSTPPTPTDKPLRSKRSHRKGTPPAGGQLGSSLAGVQHASPGSAHHQQQLLHSMNPMSSAQSTPDPGRSAPFFSTINTTSPPAVNGNAAPVLPSIHSLPPLQPQRQPEPSRGAFFDPAYDERPAGAEHDTEPTGRPRALSGAQAPPAAVHEPQNGDTEMTDASGAGFTSVNKD